MALRMDIACGSVGESGWLSKTRHTRYVLVIKISYSKHRQRLGVKANQLWSVMTCRLQRSDNGNLFRGGVTWLQCGLPRNKKPLVLNFPRMFLCLRRLDCSVAVPLCGPAVHICCAFQLAYRVPKFPQGPWRSKREPPPRHAAILRRVSVLSRHRIWRRLKHSWNWLWKRTPSWMKPILRSESWNCREEKQLLRSRI